MFFLVAKKNIATFLKSVILQKPKYEQALC